ncbi:nonribosomal peptide synthetase 7 [Pseudovirgaria hyperparasitica]|uniref:Nonribosomal peptide synthetase 7 n=1 Tax=Pseudovirgaria hyperparasitica TaxID=470096 RepID=A0A6A6VZ12_9PEZI|nr:nonribosomal peptide synthetase 7 [Pseudovirgaria hyperparasitica]KAF2755475.1 nonribosomal peptide synthetase 7 [Pseudovirgaria hyperparasitica]
MSDTCSSRAQEGVGDEFNATDDATTLGLCLHHLIDQVIKTNSENVAAICGDQKLSYAELGALVDRYASILEQHSVKRGDLVGIVLDRSLMLVVVLLAVLKAGAAYVPIDPTFPQDRIHHMLEDADPKLVVVEASTESSMSFWRGPALNIDTVEKKLPHSTTASDSHVDPDDLAYVIYTSGSTGKPKGVEISHEALCNLLLGIKSTSGPGCRASDRLLAVTTISFDIAMLEIFLPLICGATVVVAQKAETRDPRALMSMIKRHSITIMQATPATWQMILESGWHSDVHLSTIICGGEALPQKLANRLLSCAESVWNVYGPTEATVWASMWRVCPDQPVVIGRPINNYRLYVLDNNDLSRVPIGTEGELFIGGASLARGYHKKPEITQERFIHNPFHPGLMYRTGDLARFDSLDSLRVLGRADGQVKIRGFRIEVGDIEAAITDHDDIAEAVVNAQQGRLVAYCIRKQKTQTKNGCEDSRSIETFLRPFLKSRLPEYMMPAFYLELKEFPMTPNKKIDRKALPVHTEVVKPQAMSQQPQTGLESSIRLIWSEVLGHDRITTEANFFEIGGDSIRVIKVQKALEQLLDRILSPAILFEHFTIKALPDRGLSTNHITADESIAIVSMACQLPGGVTSPQEFWDLLERGADVITSVPKDRWDAEELYSAGLSYCRRGGFLDSVDEFDAPFFGISPREARSLDPTQRIGLETCWEGLERAGYTAGQLRGSNTGVYMGVCTISAHNSSVPSLGELDGYAITGTAGSTLSGRVSYAFGLEGPNMTIDTACSSSLVTTHLACNALRQGECDLAISGGISLLLSPAMHVEFSRLNGMSIDGRCRAFANDNSGTGWSEGCTVVVLKRLSDAMRDKDHIHAVIRGTAVNHGGRSAPGLTVPSGKAQQRLIQTALQASRLSPGDIDLVEAHGTGTRLGDPIEGVALAGVYGGSRSVDDEPLWVGSCKSSFGHTQAAAGLAGVIKVVMAMKNNKIPQTLHATKPTQAVDWEGSRMALVQEAQPWHPRLKRARRAGVSAFGISGTNAHVVVEEPPRQIPDHQLDQDDGDSDVEATELPHYQSLESRRSVAMPFLLSGHTEVSLAQQAEKLKQHISAHGQGPNFRLRDIAFSLATTRTLFGRRDIVWAKNRTTLISGLDSIAQTSSASIPATSTSRLAMLFTGQGSQACGMGKGLYEAYPIFRVALDEIVARFSGLDVPLLEVMHAPSGSEAASLLQRTDYAQPALFSLGVALWSLWKSWGVVPDVLCGHSVGELVAAHVAGVLSLTDACILVEARGRLMQAVPMQGAMVSLQASWEEVEKAIDALELNGQIDIAGRNTPMQTVASGDISAVERIASYFAGYERKTKLLDVSKAFHSHHMDTILTAFRSVAENVEFKRPQLPIVSTLTGRLCEPGEMETPDYWVQQIRQAVRFTDAVQTLFLQDTTSFVELGPRPILAGMGAACLENEQTITWLPSIIHGKDEATTIQRSLTELHKKDISIDWTGYFGSIKGCQRVELPTYAFHKERYPPLRKNTLSPPDGHQGLSMNAIKAQDMNDPPDASIEPRATELAITWKESSSKGTITADPSKLTGTWGMIRSNYSGPLSMKIMDGLLQNGLSVRWVDLQDINTWTDLSGLLCVWEPQVENDVDHVEQLTTEAFAQLQAIIRAQLAQPLLWVTLNAVDTGSGEIELPGLHSSTLWGLMRTARNEHTELSLRLVDLDINLAADTSLVKALAMINEPECAVRHSGILLPRLENVNITSRGAQLLRTDGAVIITGGLGSLGRRVAMWLAISHNIRDIVLLSRRGTDTPGTDSFVKELADAGAQATVLSCDIASRESVDNAISLFTALRPLRGVVHTAGLLDDGALQDLTPERINRVLGPKVHGAWNLHQSTQGLDLDMFLIFSSISGIIGNPGQSSYAAANTFLDALAYFRRSQRLPGTSVAYGPWAGGGMAEKLSKLGLARWQRMGFNMIQSDESLQLTENAIRSGRPLAAVAVLDPGRLHRFLSNDLDERSTLLSLLQGQKGRKVPPKDLKNKKEDLRSMLKQSAVTEQGEIVLTTVKATVARILGIAHSGDVDSDRALQDIGIDSLTAVQVRNHLEKSTGLKLNARIAFQYPNLRALSKFLLTSLQEDMMDSDDSSTGDISTPPTSVKSESIAPSIDIAAIKKGYLDPTLKFRSTEPTKPPNAVFVTGATGFVGAFIAAELLSMGISVHCLVRAGSDQAARQRLLDSLAAHDLWKPSFEPLLHAIVGDMSQPLFGLPDEQFQYLTETIDSICHSGGLVDWVRPLDDYLGPNIVSTHEILRLASQGREKTVHFISTMSTLPVYMGLELVEGDGEYGYATSKYTAERMVAAARWRGANASVYRLPFVTASTESGCFRLDRGDFMHSFISGCLEMGFFPSLDGADLAAVLPVDYLATTIVTKMTQDFESVGKDYDFANANPLSFNAFWKLLSLASAGQEIVPFVEWRERAFAHVASHRESPLARIMALIDGVKDEKNAVAFVTGPMVGPEVLGGKIYPVPEIDERVARNYVTRITINSRGFKTGV